MIRDILVVGAGLCGLHAAGQLQSAGRSVLVLEKSRGFGGRAATRRWQERPVDHGAQFFTAKSPEFTAQVAQWSGKKICHEWTRGFHRYADGKLHEPSGEAFPRYACREGMSSLGRALAEPLGDLVRREAKVTRLSPDGELWLAELEDGRTFRARSLLLTPPPAQSSALLTDAAPAAAAEIARHHSLPCLAVAAAFPRREMNWQGIQAPGDEILSWIGHDTGKRPELHPGCTILMLHAAPHFSSRNSGAPGEKIVAELLGRASEMTSQDWTSPDDCFVQRWRYALPVSDGTEPGPSVYRAPAPLVVAGDWCYGGRIEGAWQAGHAASEHLLALTA